MILKKALGFAVLAGFLGLGGCAEPHRQKIAPPPLAEMPSPETIFGEATLTPGGDPQAPLTLPMMDSARSLTMDECIARARLVSPDLDSADQSRVGSLWTRWQSITAFLPQASTTYGITRFDNWQSGGGSPQSGSDRYSWNMSVMQPLFTGNRNMTNYLLADLGVSAAEISKIQARDDLILAVKQAYYDILATEKALNVARQTVVNLQSHLAVAQNFYDVGMVPRNQVLEAEVQLAEAIQMETVQTHNLVVAEARMNTLLRQPLDRPFKLDDILVYTPFPLSIEQCLAISLEERPEIKLAHNQVEVGAKNIDLARSGYYPELGLTYTASSAGDGVGAHSGWGDNASSWNIAAVAAWNFWEWGRTKAEVEKSKVDMNRAVNALTSLEDATKLGVTSNYNALLSAGKNIEVSAKAVVAAAEDLRMVTERYQEQVATNTDVLDSQTRYSEAQYEHYQSLYNYNLAWASLERSLGRQVRSSLNDPEGGY